MSVSDPTGVVELVDSLIRRAIASRATDVHFEPGDADWTPHGSAGLGRPTTAVVGSVGGSKMRKRVVMRSVYLARDASTAELVRNLLEAAGICSAVLGTALASASGDIPFTAAYPQVCVDEADRARAAQLIRESGIEPDPQRCPNCGYILQGLPIPSCPECGTPFPSREPVTDWNCPACGETIEGQFTACWRCGAQREAQSD